MFHPQGFEICFLNTALGQREGFACLELIGLLQKHFHIKYFFTNTIFYLMYLLFTGTEIFISNGKISSPDF